MERNLTTGSVFKNVILFSLPYHRMRIAGFSREVTLIDAGVTNDPEKFVTEICIPIMCENV